MLTRYIHGSSDSTDLDIHYVFPKLPSFRECQQFCSENPLENRNIIVIDNGFVTHCFKGTPDEINNGLFITYHLHNQEFPLLVKGMIERDVLIKCVRAVRCLLSHYSRTEYRPQVKQALKSHSWDEKLTTLKKIDYNNVTDFKKDTRENVFKIFAFQLGQTLALLDGIELFTKSDIANHFPTLQPYLYRASIVDPSDLVAFIHDFVDRLKGLQYTEAEQQVYFPQFQKTINLNKEEYV